MRRNGWATRRECGLPERAPLLLNIGRIAKEKNLEQVMRVFPKLLNACPDVHFAIVGEGPMREDLGRMAEELGVSRAVTLTGPKPWEKIDRYYAMGDVFCSASHSETQGLTYVEAMASGLCVCAVNDPCLDGVVEDGVSGILAGGQRRVAAGRTDPRIRRGRKADCQNRSAVCRAIQHGGLCRKGGSLLSESD